jgi:glycosyltransferase involved in cell wall biosynthesis
MDPLPAFSVGLPVVASRIGSFPDIVFDGVNGRLFEAGNTNDLVQNVLAIERGELSFERMRKGARESYEKHFTPERNLTQLEEIYRAALEESRI